MRTITSTIDLDAPAEEVWDVLTDTAAYPRWNPFITRLDGTLEVGDRVRLRISPPNGRPKIFCPVITDVEPCHRLAWLGRLLVPGLFDGAHSLILQPTDDGRTRLVHSETFRGLLVWFSRGLLKNTAAGFEAMNAALRARLGEAVPGNPHPAPGAAQTGTSPAATLALDAEALGGPDPGEPACSRPVPRSTSAVPTTAPTEPIT